MSLEKVILGTLILSPRFLELTEISDNLFKTESRKKVFRVITQLWEQERPQEIDLTLLASRMGGDEDFSFVSSLLDGLQHLSEENFLSYVNERKKQMICERINFVSQKNANYHLKCGNLDPELTAELRRLWIEFDSYDTDIMAGHAAPSLTISLSNIEPQEVAWLWPNFIPLGRASMISGDPNVGKTWFALDITARLSKGLAWPDGNSESEAANIIYLSLEDNPSDTIRPRIDSLGGDPSKIAIINPDYSDFISFAKQDGIKKLEQEILKIANVRLVVLDPILDFSGEINPNAAEQVRAFLTPLIYIAEKFNLALILIAHLNKAQSQSAIYRTGGSTSAWLGKCRAAFMIFRDSEEKKKRYISAIKSNLAQDDPPQLSFIPNNGRLIFEKVIEEIDVEEHLNPQRQGGREESSFAKSWLKEALKDGPVEWKELRKAAEEAGILKDSIYRAGKKLGAILTCEGFGKFKTSLWSLSGKEKT